MLKHPAHIYIYIYIYKLATFSIFLCTLLKNFVRFYSEIFSCSLLHFPQFQFFSSSFVSLYFQNSFLFSSLSSFITHNVQSLLIKSLQAMQWRTSLEFIGLLLITFLCYKHPVSFHFFYPSLTTSPQILHSLHRKKKSIRTFVFCYLFLHVWASHAAWPRPTNRTFQTFDAFFFVCMVTQSQKMLGNKMVANKCVCKALTGKKKKSKAK